MPRFDRRVAPVRALGAEGCRDLGDDRGVAEWNRMDLRREVGVLRHLRGFLDDYSSSRPRGSRVATESLLVISLQESRLGKVLNKSRRTWSKRNLWMRKLQT